MTWAKRVYGVGAVVAALGAASCTYTGGVENPVARKFSWFSYVGGDDVRNRCRPGSPTEYRLVYNANWTEQVRAYELRRSVIVGGGARLDTVVFGGEPTKQLNLLDPFEQYAGQKSAVQITEADYLALIRAIEDSGFGRPAARGLRLKSFDFYWAVSACAAGQFHFNAWVYPSDRAAAITFDKLLFSGDRAPVRPNPVRHIDAAQEQDKAKWGQYDTFELMVSDNGLTFGPVF